MEFVRDIKKRCFQRSSDKEKIIQLEKFISHRYSHNDSLIDISHSNSKLVVDINIDCQHCNPGILARELKTLNPKLVRVTTSHRS